MQTIKLIPPLFLCLILMTSCGVDASFTDGKAVISQKTQNSDEKKFHEARYEINFFNKNGYICRDLVFEFPEDFGEVNDILIMSNRVLLAVPDNQLEK